MIKKNLGGDRLGSGNKMNVYLHGYGRSNHNLNYVWKNTQAPGTLVPFLKKVLLPGDTFDVDLEAMVYTKPAVGPLFGSYKLQLDLFECPIRLYQGQLHNNKLRIGNNMEQVKLPKFTLTAPPFNPDDYPNGWQNLPTAQISPSSIFAYLGLRGIGRLVDDLGTPDRDFNAVPWLAYWDIFKNYYANKQEDQAYVIHTDFTGIAADIDITSFKINGQDVPEAPDAGNINTFTGGSYEITYDEFQGIPTVSDIYLMSTMGNEYPMSDVVHTVDDSTEGIIKGVLEPYVMVSVASWRLRSPEQPPTFAPKLIPFNLENLDTVREDILQAQTLGQSFYLNDQMREPYMLMLGDNQKSITGKQEGLAVKTYQSDIYNNWIQTEWIDTISAKSAIDTSGGSFTLDQLTLGRKIYDILNRVAISGGTYYDWIQVIWSSDQQAKTEIPMYVGGLSKEIVFQEVISNSQSADQPLGTLAGRGTLAQKHKGGRATIRVKEPAYLIGIVSITPRIDYSEGNEFDTVLDNMDDFHKPGLDEIGFQDLLQERFAWYTTWWDSDNSQWRTTSAGKQPAWLEYMTSVNQNYGNFAEDSEMFMTLNRKYKVSPGGGVGVDDMTTYIDPAKFNYVFAETSLDAMNFWLQIGVKIEARRVMSAKLIPNL